MKAKVRLAGLTLALLAACGGEDFSSSPAASGAGGTPAAGQGGGGQGGSSSGQGGAPQAGKGGATGGAGDSGKGGTAGAPGAGAGGAASGAGGAEAGSSGVAGTGGAGEGGQSGAGQAGSGQAGSGQAGSGQGGVSGSSGQSGAGGSDAGAGGAGQGGSAGAGGGCDGQVDPTGVFVASPFAGGADSNDGAPKTPVSTIKRALEIALASGGKRTHVYLSSESEYLEKIEITQEFASKLSIDGGFQSVNGIWQKTCDQRASVSSLEPYGVRIDNDKKLAVELLDVKIRSVDLEPNSAGKEHSSYGIFARGNASLSLVGASVLAGRGRPGAPGAPGGQAPAATCPSEPACADGGNGGEGKGGKHAGAGAFDPQGFLPSSAGAGDIGFHGKPGKAGEAAKSISDCTTGCSGCPASGGCQKKQGSINVLASTCGCGGEGGVPGQPGSSGGASVGIFLGGLVSLSIKNSTITASDGGNGGGGGDGSEGSPGTPGKRGNAVPNDGSPQKDDGTAVCHKNDCFMTGTNSDCGCYYQDTKPPEFSPAAPVIIQPNPPGGTGGKGGRGGKGGNGSGGWSIALAYPKLTTPSLDASATLTFGKEGVALQGAAAGKADYYFTY